MTYAPAGTIVSLKEDLGRQFDGIADVDYLAVDEHDGWVQLEARVSLTDARRIEFRGAGLTLQHAYARLVREGAVAWLVARFNRLTAA